MRTSSQGLKHCPVCNGEVTKDLGLRDFATWANVLPNRVGLTDLDGFLHKQGSERALLLSDTDLAWAAGIFEGEGSLDIHKTNKKHHYPRIQLQMCDEEIVQRFATIFGGTVGGPYRAGGKNGKDEWSRFYSWHKVGTGAVAVMRHLYPHLGKRRQDKWDAICHELDIDFTPAKQDRSLLIEFKPTKYVPKGQATAFNWFVNYARTDVWILAGEGPTYELAVWRTDGSPLYWQRATKEELGELLRMWWQEA